MGTNTSSARVLFVATNERETEIDRERQKERQTNEKSQLIFICIK